MRRMERLLPPGPGEYNTFELRVQVNCNRRSAEEAAELIMEQLRAHARAVGQAEIDWMEVDFSGGGGSPGEEPLTGGRA